MSRVASVPAAVSTTLQWTSVSRLRYDSTTVISRDAVFEIPAPNRCLDFLKNQVVMRVTTWLNNLCISNLMVFIFR